MEFEFSLLRQTRRHLFNMASSLSQERLLDIPSGFKNNILWNIGHVIVTQQLLCCKLAGQPMCCDERMIEMFRKGTAPHSWPAEPSIAEIKPKIIGSAEQFIEDYHGGKFTDFVDYETSFGTPLKSVEDAIRFNNLHEGLHLGYILALRKAIG